MSNVKCGEYCRDYLWMLWVGIALGLGLGLESRLGLVLALGSASASAFYTFDIRISALHPFALPMSTAHFTVIN